MKSALRRVAIVLVLWASFVMTSGRPDNRLPIVGSLVLAVLIVGIVPLAWHRERQAR
jgi:hypothetical protein